MVRSTGAQIGLLAFAFAIVAGLYAGNSATVILTRAIGAMLLGAVIGQVAGWVVRLILRDHLQRKKLRIDDEHFKAMREMMVADEDESPAPEPIEVG